MQTWPNLTDHIQPTSYLRCHRNRHDIARHHQSITWHPLHSSTTHYNWATTISKLRAYPFGLFLLSLHHIQHQTTHPFLTEYDHEMTEKEQLTSCPHLTNGPHGPHQRDLNQHNFGRLNLCRDDGDETHQYGMDITMDIIKLPPWSLYSWWHPSWQGIRRRVGCLDNGHHRDQYLSWKIGWRWHREIMYRISHRNAHCDSRRYRLYKLLSSTHSVHEPMCYSTLKIALVAYEEARHRKVTGLRLTVYKQQFQSMNSLMLVHVECYLNDQCTNAAIKKATWSPVTFRCRASS